MDFRDIEKKVIEWGRERELYEYSSAEKQLYKLYEEQDELSEAIYEMNLEKAYDAIGDMLVVLTHIANFLNITMTRCYALAYEEIKDRKGKMVNGVFVKERSA